MANYIINECLTNDEYIISASTTLTVGVVIRFIFDEDVFCGTVIDESTEPIPSGYIYDAEYSDCCECLSGLIGSLNFKFIRCDTLDEIDIVSTNFCNDFGLPTIGLTYEIQFNSETPFCATFTGLTSTGETNYSYVSGPFSVCEDCENPPPISAGTEYNVCVIDCSGNTVSITPPHPTWTNEQGHAVVLLDAIALGGMNGLNN